MLTGHLNGLQFTQKTGVYKEKKEVKPDTYPRTLVSKLLDDAEEKELRRAGLKEFVGLIEFWDYKHNKIYHIHPETKQVLMEAQAPYGRPYSLQ